MKVLFVMNCNYPYTGTLTNLLNKLLFIGDLIDKIETIDVVAGKDRYEDLEFEKIGKINIYRTASWTVLPKEDILVVLKKNPILALQCVLIKSLHYIEKKINKQYFIDRYACHAFYCMLKKINAEKYDLIVTMSGRYYQTAAVLKFSEKTGQKYIFYQVDPCGTNMCMPENSQKSRMKFEKKVYTNASAVITTPIILKEQKGILSEKERQNVVGMEFPLVAKSQKIIVEKEKNSNIPVCMFIGSIYGGIRNPDYTIRLFKRLIENKKVELHFIGVNREEISAEFENINLICHGTVELNKALDLMGQADFLVNIGNSVINQVPSKIFDYISYGKPIINICKSRKCPTLSYLERYPLALNLFEEQNLLEQQSSELGDFIIKNKCREISFEEVQKEYSACTPHYCAEQMYNVMKEYSR